MLTGFHKCAQACAELVDCLALVLLCVPEYVDFILDVDLWCKVCSELVLNSVKPSAGSLIVL